MRPLYLQQGKGSGCYAQHRVVPFSLPPLLTFPGLPLPSPGAGTVTWALGDNQGTIRDLVRYNSGTGNTSVVDHLTYRPRRRSRGWRPISSSATPAASTTRPPACSGTSTAGTIQVSESG